MTASICITNTSNHDEDVHLTFGGPVKGTAILKRGESRKIGFAGPLRPLDLIATAQEPRGTDYLGELEVEAVAESNRGMVFGQAISKLKEGERVCRAGWNGKDMYLYVERWHEGEPLYQPCIVMRTADAKHQPGWLASQADMLAEDWMVVETP